VKSLHGKVAVITGSGSGIGRATAQSLAERGAKIVVADIAGDDAFAVAGEIVEAGGQAVGIRCDVRANSDFEQLKTGALDQFGGVDVVMNNVGVLTRGRPEHLPVEEWQRIIDVDLFSVVRSNAVFLPLLIEQGHGHIVNTASFAGLFTYSYDRLPYAAVKAAIVQISEGLRLYLHPPGRRCHRVVSGSGDDQHHGLDAARIRPRCRHPRPRRAVHAVAARNSRRTGCRGDPARHVHGLHPR
jgi:NAD(P)-dependent dehydrogenase (short-subunit alcohol dehydrogenase family)